MAFLCTWKSLYKRDGTATTCSWKRKVSGFAIVLFVEIGTFVSLTPNLLGQPPILIMEIILTTLPYSKKNQQMEPLMIDEEKVGVLKHI